MLEVCSLVERGQGLKVRWCSSVDRMYTRLCLFAILFHFYCSSFCISIINTKFKFDFKRADWHVNLERNCTFPFFWTYLLLESYPVMTY